MSEVTEKPEKNAMFSDVEKGASSSSVDAQPLEGTTEELSKHAFWRNLYDNGVEVHGGAPIPVDQQSDTRYFNVFTVYSTSMLSLLP